MFHHEILKWGLDRGVRVAPGTEPVSRFSTLGFSTLGVRE